eukprot:SAG31_NODE_32159_length_359_cov_0.800000_1_plen_66_part_10
MRPQGVAATDTVNMEVGGLVEIEAEIMHEEIAESKTAGPGREAPNTNPTLIEPFRFSFSCAPDGAA